MLKRGSCYYRLLEKGARRSLGAALTGPPRGDKECGFPLRKHRLVLEARGQVGLLQESRGLAGGGRCIGWGMEMFQVRLWEGSCKADPRLLAPGK